MINTPEQNWRKGFNSFLEEQDNILVHFKGENLLYKDLTPEQKLEYRKEKRQDNNIEKAVERRGIQVQTHVGKTLDK